jgi:hypothetical protein
LAFPWVLDNVREGFYPGHIVNFDESIRGTLFIAEELNSSGKTRAKWRKFSLEYYDIECSWELAVDLFLESWANLSDPLSVSRWNMHEARDELEPDDDSSDDDELELRVHSGTR